jgi:hypothetical protein
MSIAGKDDRLAVAPLLSGFPGAALVASTAS